jgi:hypothetical protein
MRNITLTSKVNANERLHAERNIDQTNLRLRQFITLKQEKQNFPYKIIPLPHDSSQNHSLNDVLIHLKQ